MPPFDQSKFEPSLPPAPREQTSSQSRIPDSPFADRPAAESHDPEPKPVEEEHIYGYNKKTGKHEDFYGDEAKAEKLRRLTEENERIKKKLIPIIDERFAEKDPKDTSIGELDMLLAFLSEKFPEIYDSYRSKISEYYANNLRSVQSEFVMLAEPSLDSYNKLILKAWALYSFQSKEITEKKVCWDLFVECQQKMTVFMEKNPDELDRFLDGKTRSLLSLRKLSSLNPGNDYDYEELAKLNPNIVKLHKDGENILCSVRWGGEIWNVKILYDTGMQIINVSSEKNPDIFVNIISEIFTGYLSGTNGKDFGIVVTEAISNYEKELSGRNTLASFDLPKDEKIGCLNFFPKDYDMVVSKDFQSSLILQNSLRNRYKGLEVSDTVFTDDPEKDISERVAESYASGVRYFYFNVSNHGMPDSISFKNPLTADAFVKLAEMYPDIKIVVGSIACFGGGLRNGFLKVFEEKPELKQRISVFLQSKPWVPNIGGVVANLSDLNIDPNNLTTADVGVLRDMKKNNSNEFTSRQDVYSTYTSLFFIKALREGHSFGDSIIYSDEKSKEFYYGDPESIVNGLLITNSGEKKDNADV